MKLDALRIQGFRCFDESGQTLSLDDFTCFVGPNASGKTAAMMALARMFSEVRAQRQVIPADFHLGQGEAIKAKQRRELCIECRLTFPELDADAGGTTVAIPEAFNQMIVEQPGGTPYCRVRLDASWIDDGTPSGDVQQSVSWILTDSEDPGIIDAGNRRPMNPGERAKIRVVYVPAARDPDHQIRGTTASTFARLLQALDWAGADAALNEKLRELREQLGLLQGVQTMNTHVQDSWSQFYDGRIAKNVTLQALDEDATGLLKLLAPTFAPGEDGHSILADGLSDGLRSLFSLSLALGLFRVEEQLRTSAGTSGFRADAASGLPSLTIFAVEEPENHLSPHYLGRIVSELADAAENERLQVVMSSHSPSILRRILPDRVRYFLGHERTPSTRVKSIPLPADESDETFKYVREAVRGHPELYFSRLVILGEGPSEEVVLRRLFEATGTPLDTNFISVVPLGGRHVNHFWRLLHALEIPFFTLLDLDQEKDGGGWGRLQYVRDQLIERYGPDHEALRFRDSSGNERSLEDSSYATLARTPHSATKKLDEFLAYLAQDHAVFFSTPLDLDFSLLEAFPDIYKSLAPSAGGPRMPMPSDPGYQKAVHRRVVQVLTSDPSARSATVGSTYTQAQSELLVWYKYLFIDGSKPVTHLRALLKLGDDVLLAYAPPALKSIVQRARKLLTPAAIVK